MKKVLQEIQEGEFAKNWILENKAGSSVHSEARRRIERDRSRVEKVGKELRKMMPWQEEPEY